jgi:hypothetical protein
MFTKSQQDLLRSVARKPKHEDLGKPNEQLDNVIFQLRRDNPRAFLLDVDLQERVFIHEPKSSTKFKAVLKPFTGERK